MVHAPDRWRKVDTRDDFCERTESQTPFATWETPQNCELIRISTDILVWMLEVREAHRHSTSAWIYCERHLSFVPRFGSTGLNRGLRGRLQVYHREKNKNRRGQIVCGMD